MPADTCNTGDPILDSPGVHDGFEALWQESLAGGIEQGGWIVLVAGSFSLIPFQNAEYDACGIDILESPPPGTVAMIHTHPWPLFSPNPCGVIHAGTPSREDVDALSTLGLATGYLIDANGFGKHNSTDGETADRIDRCAY